MVDDFEALLSDTRLKLREVLQATGAAARGSQPGIQGFRCDQPAVFEQSRTWGGPRMVEQAMDGRLTRWDITGLQEL